jgi:uncharacterized membrane protein
VGSALRADRGRPERRRHRNVAALPCHPVIWYNGVLDLIRGATLVAATMAMGLMAGLFYAFMCAVVPGLRRADDRAFVGVMQRINVAIVNAWFLLSFIGAFVFTVAAAVLHLPAAARPALPWILVALGLYVVALAITIGINIPLNNELDQAGDPDQIRNLAAVRDDFEGPWVVWNVVRFLFSAAAFGCLGRALVSHRGDPTPS